MQLTVDRVYGSQGIIKFYYQTYTSPTEPSAATPGLDYQVITEGHQNLDAKQTKAVIMIKVIQQNPHISGLCGPQNLSDISEIRYIRGHFYCFVTRRLKTLSDISNYPI